MNIPTLIYKNNEIDAVNTSNINEDIYEQEWRRQSSLEKKGTCAIIGDSVLRGTDQTCMSRKSLIKVRRFLGATVKSM